MWVLEQHWECGTSRLTKLKVGINEGFSWGLSKISKKGKGVKKGGSNIMGDRLLCPSCINHCKIYCYCKICLELPKCKPADKCTILNKLNSLTFAYLGRFNTYIFSIKMLRQSIISE